MGHRFKTTLLLASLTAIILYIGQMMGGYQGLVIALVFTLLFNGLSYWYSDKLVLTMYRARAVDPEQTPELYGLLRDLCQQGNLPMPRLYIIPSPHPNAFATGRNPQHAAVAVTEGLLQLLDREEVKGVLAHELGHVKNRDTLLSTLAATLAGAITHLAFMARWAFIFGGGNRNNRDGGPWGMVLVALVAPIAAMLIQMAISRSREFLADEAGARLAGHPMGLISALEKLQYGAKRVPLQGGNPATAHLFIVNPLRGGAMAKLFSTHPPLEERIQRLKAITPY